MFSEDDLFKPIISAYDILPLKVKYVSFKNLLIERLSFYYGFYPSEKIVDNVLIKNPLLVNPLLLDVGKIIGDLKISLWDAKLKLQLLANKLLVQYSKYYESWDKVYRNPVQLTEKYQPTGYTLRMPLYLQGSRDAYILLTTTSTVPTDNVDVYEILIGSILSDTAHYIKKNGKLLVTSNESGILSSQVPSKIVIEITNGKSHI